MRSIPLSDKKCLNFILKKNDEYNIIETLLWCERAYLIFFCYQKKNEKKVCYCCCPLKFI